MESRRTSPPDLEPHVLEGPWDQAFAMVIPFAVRSKSNFRRDGDRGQWKRLERFESDLGVLVRAAVPRDWDMGDKDKPLAKRPVVVNFIYAVSALDTANLSKSVLDACEKRVFHTDASVRALSAVSHRSSKDSWGLVAFARLAPGSSEVDLLASLNELSRQGLALATG